MKPELVSLPEAAVALAISLSTVKRLIHDGRLPSVHVGASRRVPTAAIREFVAQLCLDEGLSDLAATVLAGDDSHQSEEHDG